MAQVRVHVRTIERTTDHDEFYRTYEIRDLMGDGISVWQWGPRKGGRKAGQYKLVLTSTSALKKIGDKLREGYSKVSDYEFSMNDAILRQIMAEPLAAGPQAKKIGKLLDDFRDTLEDGRLDTAAETLAGSFASEHAPTGDVPNVNDALDRLALDLQNAIADVIDDPRKAFDLMDTFRERIDVMESQTLRIKSFFETLEMVSTDSLSRL